MPRFDVSLHLEIDAEDAEEALQDVKANYGIFNRLGFVSFTIDDQIYEIDNSEFCN